MRLFCVVVCSISQVGARAPEHVLECVEVSVQTCRRAFSPRVSVFWGFFFFYRHVFSHARNQKRMWFQVDRKLVAIYEQMS